jgi:hypothetical protein
MRINYDTCTSSALRNHVFYSAIVRKIILGILMAKSWSGPIQATHLGIKRDNKSKTGTKQVVADRIQIAR